MFYFVLHAFHFTFLWCYYSLIPICLFTRIVWVYEVAVLFEFWASVRSFFVCGVVSLVMVYWSHLWLYKLLFVRTDKLIMNGILINFAIKSFKFRNWRLMLILGRYFILFTKSSKIPFITPRKCAPEHFPSTIIRS